MKILKVVLMCAVCLSLNACETIGEIDTCSRGAVVGPLVCPILVATDYYDYGSNNKEHKKYYQRYSVKPYKPQKLMKPRRSYGDIRRDW